LTVYFIKLISSYNVLQITKQISFYTILMGWMEIGEQIRNLGQWLNDSSWEQVVIDHG